jgi:hypothetical protein
LFHSGTQKMYLFENTQFSLMKQMFQIGTAGVVCCIYL